MDDTLFTLIRCKNNQGLLEYLIKERDNEFSDFDIERADIQINMPALHFAAHEGNLEAIQILIDFGADVNAKNCEGETPLSSAVYREREACVRYLVKDCGADINIINEFDSTALGKSINNGNVAISKLLIQDGLYVKGVGKNNVNYLQESLIQGGLEDIIEPLISVGSDINEEDGFGSNSWHYAVKYETPRALEIFASIDSSKINEFNANGYSPLQIAMTEGYWKEFETLLKLGADYEMNSRYGNDLNEICGASIDKLSFKEYFIMKHEISVGKEIDYEKVDKLLDDMHVVSNFIKNREMFEHVISDLKHMILSRDIVVTPDNLKSKLNRRF